MLSERSRQKRVYTEQFNFYIIVENASESIVIESRSIVMVMVE